MTKKAGILSAIVVFFLSIVPLHADDLEELSDETVLHVISFLGPQDVVKFGEASKRHHALANDDHLWRGLCLQTPQVQEFTKKQGQTENRDLSHKEFFINYFKALKNFKTAEKEAWFVIETRLLLGYNISITYETVHPPHGIIWNFFTNDIHQMRCNTLLNCVRDPRNENICLLAEKDFNIQNPKPKITHIVAIPQSQDLTTLFVRGSGDSLSILPFHKIVVEQVTDTQSSPSFLTGAFLKLSVEPLPQHIGEKS